MAPINIYDFSDKLNADGKLRKEFISKYVDHLVNTLDTDDIIRSWTDMMHESLYSECHQDGADGLVEMIAGEYPELLQSEFDVDTSLVN
jgi:hypothetical protein